ncbi:thioesterase II family protein [Streptomyces diastaticus]|uniref:thioesterase II family protein n=1 Tax=Streptomyces diastaticus TaxID=1956 RepID=UPI003658CB36
MNSQTDYPTRWDSSPPGSGPSRREGLPQLFCFPFAGGGASAFRPWVSQLADVAEVCPVRLPGREDRRSEPLPTDINALAEQMADELADRIRAPYVLYGHSMGAQLAYRFVHAVVGRQLPPPDLLIAAAHRAPHQAPLLPLTYSLPRDAMVEWLRECGATPAAVLDSEKVLDFFLPTLRSDFALSELCPEYGYEQPLDVPILALGGEDDPLVSEDNLDAWALHTASRFRASRFPGGHFFHMESEAQVLDLMRSELHGLGTA